MKYYVVLDKVFIKDGKYYFEAYGSKLPIEQATLYNISDDKLQEYINDGYKLMKINGRSTLVRHS